MSAVDASVVNTVLPLIKAGLGTSVETIQSVVPSYLLWLSGLLLTFGRMGDVRGHRRIYLLGFGIFLGGSICCAAAPGVWILIPSRASSQASTPGSRSLPPSHWRGAPSRWPGGPPRAAGAAQNNCAFPERNAVS
jgi:MFS family permease